MKKNQLTEDEAQIERQLEQGEWAEVPNWRKDLPKLKAAAKRTLNKNERVNVRLTRMDLTGLRRRAAVEGLPYQTLISSVLHKYVTGTLAEPKR